jgi:hypothetical protein
MHTILSGRVFFARTAETVEAGGYAYVLESQRLEGRDKLCLRQSAGYSPGPQVNVAANVLPEFDIEYDIRKL